MRKHDPKNERIKRQYERYLFNALGKDEKTVIKTLAAIRRFEESTKYKPFSLFRIDQAVRFKETLKTANSVRTGLPLAFGTIDGVLRQVKAFFLWLAGQPGYKSKVSYPDCEYFNNSLKDARIAHTAQPANFPTMNQCAHAFQSMPVSNEFERRDKALFAFLMLTGARISATASLRLRHINLAEGHVYQDAREVATKHAKTIDTWFFPVGNEYRECFENWVSFLQNGLLFGPGDALFPKTQMRFSSIKGFKVVGLSREPYANTGPLIMKIRQAFLQAQLPEFTPHLFRKTLVVFGDEVCPDRRSFKAWSLNLGHESVATTVSAYMPVSRDSQRELMRALGEV